jgi:hypothetical protein
MKARMTRAWRLACSCGQTICALATAVMLAAGCGEHNIQQSSSPASLPSPPPVALPVGLAALTDLTSLAELRPPGYRVEQVSSYDRTGGNADLGIGPDTLDLIKILEPAAVELDNSYLYRDGDRYVIFDGRGPGVVYRIWMTGVDGLFHGALGGDIAFELDDEATPRLTVSRQELFSGTHPPFVAPLAGDLAASSGGFYSVVPIPFAQRLRISTSTVPNWVHVTAARLPLDAPIASFDPAVDTTGASAQLAAAGVDPKGIVPTIHAAVALNVPAAGTQVAWAQHAAGTVVQLELYAPPGVAIPIGLRLQAYWDEAAVPQVDVPLDDFFGAALGLGARSLAFGQDGDRYYCYFAMPFQRSARIELRNDGDTDFTGWQLQIGAVDRQIAAHPGYFHATANAAEAATNGQDYMLLDTQGTGHVVGVVLTAGCAARGQCQLPPAHGDGAHLEGDEHIAVDGSRYPQIHGTGVEDFFNGGFYFIRGPFTLPTHGDPVQVPSTSPRRPGLNLRAAYRLFLGDAIPYHERIRLGIEHGPTNDVPAEMSSVVFYYAVPDPSLVDADRIAIGSAESEAAHQFEVEGRVDRTLQSAFRGEQSSQIIEAAGVEATRTGFRMAIPADNRGIRLRRLADIGAGRQAADISVDGQPVGKWYSADINPVLRWAELDFDVPDRFTRGRSSIDVDIDARQSPTPWTAYGYAAFSFHD